MISQQKSDELVIVVNIPGKDLKHLSQENLIYEFENQRNIYEVMGTKQE